MAVNRVPSRGWNLYRELFSTIQHIIQGSNKEIYAKLDLETTLRKFKPDFVSFLQNSPRNADDRNAVRQANHVGLTVQLADGTGVGPPQTLSTDFITEALTISDLFDLNELASVELLLAGEVQQPYYPGLPRGLVGILLYYDGKACIARAMRTLLQARSGRTWALPGLDAEVIHTVTTFTDQLIEEGLVGKILDLLQIFDVSVQLERLESPEVRALGPPRHRKQVSELITDVRQTLADSLFCVSAQSGLSSRDTILLINHLSRDKSLGQDGSLNDVSLGLIMGLLYAVDVRILEQEDTPELIQKLPIMRDASYVGTLHREICSEATSWAMPGILAMLRFAWALTIHTLSQYSVSSSDADNYALDDEPLIDAALAGDVFTFLRTAVIANGSFHREEYYLRKVHYLVTDFIVQMPLKTKDLRNSGDETARIIMASISEGLVPAENLRRDFEYMLALIADLYSRDPLGLELALDFWCPIEQSSACDASMLTGIPMAVYGNPSPQRQTSLYKFVRLAGDILLPPLYVPYINALVGLANGKQCAHHCFNLLRMNGGTQLGGVSWEHFFASLNQYYASLRQEVPQAGYSSYMRGTSYRTHGTPMAVVRSITPQEVDGLRAVLSLIGTVVKQDESSRIAMSENQVWHPLVTLVGLLTCAVPVKLKGAILDVLAAFAKTNQIASMIWQSMEMAQVLQTIAPSVAGRDNHGSGIQLELEEVESRNEEYPMLIAYLELMNELTNSSVPPALGAGYRIPGFQPYLDFLCDSVLMKFNNRAYKKASEKWQVAAAVLEILKKLLSDHEIRVEDFIDEPCFDGVREGAQPAVLSKPPGHTLLMYMSSDSNVLRTVLFIIDEACRAFDRHVQFPGKSELELASLYCLKIIEVSLQKQGVFLDAIRQSGAPVIGARMDKLLLSVNPRSGRSDHLVNIAKFVAHNNSLPKHAYSALRILIASCQSPVVHSKIVGLFTASDDLSAELLRGFVECLESEEPESAVEVADEFVELDIDESQMRSSLRQDVVWLLLSVIDQPAPNLAHFLLGFDIHKPISRTTLQDAGVLGCPRTCLHAVVSALSRGVDTRQGPVCQRTSPQFAELAYRLVFVLCSDRETSGAVLRYLRTHDFLYRHLRHFPVAYSPATDEENSLLMQQSWLMKAVVVELRVTSINRQRSHTHRLMNILLDDSISLQSMKALKADGGLEPDYIQFDADYTVLNTTRQAVHVETQANRKLLTLLGSVGFNLSPPSPPELNFFSGPVIEQVLTGCEQLEPQQGTSLYNVKLLHKILMRECNALPAAMTGQRTLIIEEVQRICSCAVERNAYRSAISARRQAFDAWRQVVEILLTACPGDLLQGELRQNVIFELLQDLLDKVSKVDAVNELTFLVAGVLLTLMAHLSHIFHTSDMAAMLSSSVAAKVAGDEDRYYQYVSMLDDAHSLPSSAFGCLGTDGTGGGTGSRTVYASSLQVVLRGLLQHMLSCSGSPPRVRAYLYGTLLYYLQIAQKPKPINISVSAEPCVEIDIGGEFDRLTRDNMTTINSYGSNLMDLICRDACDGHDVGRMLSLSALDLLISVDYQRSWFSHLSSHGFVQHIVDSLLQDDDQLKNLLHPKPEPLRALYIFQSKIALLTRLAQSRVTAKILLDCSLSARLAQCTVFDLRPESDRTAECFIPSMLARYRQQILFPVLRLLLALLVSFGRDNRLAANQVLLFITAHSDVFLSILRDRQQNITQESLQELALVTAVVGRAAVDDNVDDWSQPESRATIRRLQRQMLALLAKYCAIESRHQQHKLHVAAAAELAIINPVSASSSSAENVDLEDIVTQMEISIYEILSNITTLCTALVSKAGSSARNFRTLFEPSLFETVPRDPTALQDFISTMCNSLANPSSPPRLGLILYLLNTSSQQFSSTLETYKQLHRKYNNLSDMTPDEMKRLYSSCVLGDASSEAASIQKRSQVVSARLGHSLHYKSQQLRQLSYIIENCMFLLWRHLEFYLVHCTPVDTRASLFQLNVRRQQMKSLTGQQVQDDRMFNQSNADLGQSAGVTHEQLELLKRDVAANLNDTLFKRLKDMEECYTRGRTRHGFVSAIIRRLVRLARLHTVVRP